MVFVHVVFFLFVSFLLSTNLELIRMTTNLFPYQSISHAFYAAINRSIPDSTLIF